MDDGSFVTHHEGLTPLTAPAFAASVVRTIGEDAGVFASTANAAAQAAQLGGAHAQRMFDARFQDMRRGKIQDPGAGNRFDPQAKR
eukprot:1182052-Alexandrium_andersonii.AAC.1